MDTFGDLVTKIKDLDEADRLLTQVAEMPAIPTDAELDHGRALLAEARRLIESWLPRPSETALVDRLAAAE